MKKKENVTNIQEKDNHRDKTQDDSDAEISRQVWFDFKVFIGV